MSQPDTPERLGARADAPMPYPTAAGVAPSLGDDLLAGAEAIAVELGYIKDGMSEVDKKLARRRVYYLGEVGDWPIWKERGVGLMATRSGLRDHVRRRAAAAATKGTGN